MKKISFFINLKKELSKELSYIVDTLKSYNVNIYAKEELKEKFFSPYINYNVEENIQYIDMIISFGGDGTLLAATRYGSPMNIPILGLSLGNFGFLTPFSLHSFRKYLPRIMQNRYILANRMRLVASIKRKDKIIIEESALNDYVIARTGFSRIIKIKTLINGVNLGSFRADGVIVSTSAGSTAYSLSAGGPIINPDYPSIIINPLNPHTLTMRPIVLSPEDIIEMEIIDADNSVQLTGDGQTGCKLLSGDVVKIIRSNITTKLILPENHTFYETVRKKLNWAK